jgi:hypothetical protein
MGEIKYLSLGPDRFDIDEDNFNARNAVSGEERCGAANETRAHNCYLALPDHRRVSFGNSG